VFASPTNADSLRLFGATSGWPFSAASRGRAYSPRPASLAWIHRNIFALCVVLQVGSLLAVTGGRIPKVHGRAGGTAACRPGADGHVHQLALGHRMGPDRQLRRVGIVIAAPGSACERGLANRIGEWGRRALSSVASTASCRSGDALEQRLVDGEWLGRRRRAADRADREVRGNTRDRGGEAERRADLVAGVHESRRETRRLRPHAGERSLVASGCRAVTVCTGAPQPWASELSRGTMSAELGGHATRAPAESRSRRR
jgi:hypothetical protein